MKPPPIGAAMERRSSPNHSSPASATRTSGTTSAPQPSDEKRDERHQWSRTAFSSTNSATSDSTANATSAIAATSLRMRDPSAGTAPRRSFLAVRRATSDLHDHGQHHRAALGALVQIRRDDVVDLIADRRDLGEVLAALRLAEAVEHAHARALHQVGGVLFGHEALGHDVRSRDDRARLP